MDKSGLKKEWIALGVAAVISAVLLLAAVGKFLHPAKYFEGLDRWISVLEVLLLLCILFFRKRLFLWLGAALLFSSWAGYALFWHCVDLPCGCMGSKLNIPTLFSISLDVLFLLVSLFLAYLLGARRHLFFCFVACIALGLFGFSAGNFVFRHYVFPKAPPLLPQALPDSASVIPK